MLGFLMIPKSILVFATFVFHLVIHSFIYLFIFISLYILLFLAALGLRCCAWAFSSCGERGLLFVVVCRLLIAGASLVAEHGALGTRASVVVARGLSSYGLRALEHGLSSCGAQA